METSGVSAGAQTRHGTRSEYWQRLYAEAAAEQRPTSENLPATTSIIVVISQHYGQQSAVSDGPHSGGRHQLRVDDHPPDLADVRRRRRRATIPCHHAIIMQLLAPAAIMQLCPHTSKIELNIRHPSWSRGAQEHSRQHVLQR
eukprot:COSAG01_NODE_5482_length_4231_cov_1.956438_1_plen_142_part_10